MSWGKLLFVVRFLWPLVVAFSISDLAHAQSKESQEEEAKIHFSLGKKYFETGRFAASLAEFEKAYELTHNARLLYNIYLSAEKVGDFERAASALEAYLPTIPDSEPDLRANIEGRLEATRRTRDRMAALEAKNDAAGGQLESDKDEAPSRAKDPKTKSAAAQTGAQTQAEPGGDEGGGGVLPWILVGTGGAMLVASVVTGFVTGGLKSDYTQSCSSGTCDANTRNTGEMMLTLTDVFLFGGIAIAGAGLIWWLLTRGGGESKEKVAAAPYMSAQGGGLSLAGRF